jgi:hypothetical protein
LGTEGLPIDSNRVHGMTYRRTVYMTDLNFDTYRRDLLCRAHQIAYQVLCYAGLTPDSHGTRRVRRVDQPEMARQGTQPKTNGYKYDPLSPDDRGQIKFETNHTPHMTSRGAGVQTNERSG